MRSPLSHRRWVAALVLSGLLSADCSGSPMAPPPPAVAEPPKISCPADVTISAAGQMTSVSFAAPTVTGGTAPVTVGCTPPSGSSFPIGRSTSTCTATDARQQVAACTLTITVNAIPTLAATRFVAFGDSITEGKLANGAVIQNGYPFVFRGLLAGRYTTQEFVVQNRGISGERSDQGLARLPGVLGSDAPQVLLLMEGVNDLSSGDPAAIPVVLANLRAMVQLARSRGVAVFVGTLLPEFPGGSPDRSGARDLIVPANDQIRAMADSQGAVVVDLYQAFIGQERVLIGGDGLHPNEAGYERMAQAFFEAIRQRLEPLPSRSITGQYRPR